MTKNENTVIQSLKMWEHRTSSDELEVFYHPDAQQIEFSNALTKQCTIRTLQESKDTSTKGSKVLPKEAYEVKDLISTNDTVVLECVARYSCHTHWQY